MTITSVPLLELGLPRRTASSTTPEMSEPEMWGRLTFVRGGPILSQMSRWLRAQAFTLTSTSPPFLGRGLGRPRTAAPRTLRTGGSGLPSWPPVARPGLYIMSNRRLRWRTLSVYSSPSSSAAAIMVIYGKPDKILVWDELRTQSSGTKACSSQSTSRRTTPHRADQIKILEAYFQGVVEYSDRMSQNVLLWGPSRDPERP